MNYRSSAATLVVEGSFLAASTGVGGGLNRAAALFNHTVPRDWHDDRPEVLLDEIARQEGIPGPYFGLLTAVPMTSLVVCRCGFLTVFITAGISNRTINIIGVSSEGMTGNAILESLCTISSAKTFSLQEDGRRIMSTPTDAVIMACEGEAVHRYAGSVTAVGSRLTECVKRGVPLALTRYETGAAVPAVIDVRAPLGDGNGE